MITVETFLPAYATVDGPAAASTEKPARGCRFRWLLNGTRYMLSAFRFSRKKVWSKSIDLAASTPELISTR
jgi:hypothetical protein